MEPKLLDWFSQKPTEYNKIYPETEVWKIKHEEQRAKNTHKLCFLSQMPPVYDWWLFTGKNVVRIALKDIINTLKKKRGEVLCTAVDESVPFAKYKTIIEQYERDLLKYNIKERIIIRQGTKGLFLKGSSKYRKVPDKYFNPNPVQIYGDNVQTIVWGNPDYLIIIRNKNVADSYRKQFELMWRVASK